MATARYSPADSIVMHPRRWAWILAALDGDGRPFIVPDEAGPTNARGTVGDPVAEARAGMLQSSPEIVDPNIPTNLGAGCNQDVIIAALADSILWTEGGLVPKQLRVDEPKPATNSLQVRLVTYGYSAFTAGRYPAAISTITGTKLVPPTFA